jgi:hypothetical protein
MKSSLKLHGAHIKLLYPLKHHSSMVLDSTSHQPISHSFGDEEDKRWLLFAGFYQFCILDLPGAGT